jgi:hypothetical protein
MKQLITDTNWRGVPCTLRYNDSLKPVCEGDMFGESQVVGGSAPHKESSTGYMLYANGDRRYVNGCRWVEDFEPNAYAVMVRYKKKVMNMTTGKKEWDTWGQAGSYSIEHCGDDEAYLMAHGKARLIEMYDSNNECHVKAVLDPHFQD